ncbi:DUF481 domain-containing protein [Providencia burhodogranariea]|uniref:Peptide chain release factor RF-3 n=1 Tax=Providencia burhodogranariea DSM 19968 TaxID=1141662 RepID=K8WSN9_9GAMM|nr:DUF481 domain-containing protein [Providencia burhodogranariea]EKT62951.1 hypothetical protein OOA_05726 [Providencia burhodogranariea DSM 19968]
MRKFYILFLIPFATYSIADNIYLKNGDLISGNIKIIDSDSALITTEYAGQLRIELNKIKSFNITEPAIIKNEHFSAWKKVDSINKSKDGEVILINGENSHPIPITNDLVLSKKIEGEIPKDYKITGSLNAGGSYNKSASKSEKYSLDGNMQILQGEWRQGLNASMTRNKDDKKINSYYYNLGYQLDHFISTSFFWRGSFAYQHDWIEEIKSKGGMGTGPGWQVWNDELSSLSFTGLLSYQQLKYRDDNDEKYMEGSLSWDFNQYLFAKTMSVYTKGRIGRGFNNDVSLDLNMRIGMMYYLTDSLNLNTNIVREKINAEKGDSSNTNYIIGVGYKW